ncbi:MAG TPA: hypothetical protein EYP08_02970 [Pyrodictiaceae archaeon]|nr:hypothetical protein [Pyrodictiaceae archaeon]HIQ55408.1 hypothetical protein [Pyrodictium sp.]
MVDTLTIVMGATAGFIAGYAAGYSLRKMINWFLFILGSQLLVLMYLEKLEVITIHWNRLGELLATSISALQGTISIIESMALTVPLVGFAAGFIVGFTQGG